MNKSAPIFIGAHMWEWWLALVAAFAALP